MPEWQKKSDRYWRPSEKLPLVSCQIDVKGGPGWKSLRAIHGLVELTHNKELLAADSKVSSNY